MNASSSASVFISACIQVCRGVYRSGFPGKKNFSFLKKLGLHTVLNLSEHEYPKETKLILAENKVRPCTCSSYKSMNICPHTHTHTHTQKVNWPHLPMVGNREPMQSTDESLLVRARCPATHPIYAEPLLPPLSWAYTTQCMFWSKYGPVYGPFAGLRHVETSRADSMGCVKLRETVRGACAGVTGDSGPPSAHTLHQRNPPHR